VTKYFLSKTSREPTRKLSTKKHKFNLQTETEIAITEKATKKQKFDLAKVTSRTVTTTATATTATTTATNYRNGFFKSILFFCDQKAVLAFNCFATILF